MRQSNREQTQLTLAHNGAALSCAALLVVWQLTGSVSKGSGSASVLEPRFVMKSPETLSTSAKDNQLKLLVAVQEKPTQT
ncbi:hypothetical protein BA893_12145 [Vibrio natriegens]|nr:hypothetical protein BA893_12145 [Vibrio natriegens]